MSSLTLLISLSLAVVPPGGDQKKDSSTKPTESRPPDAKYEITGPYVHDNLALYLVHGRDVLKEQVFLTLQEALEQEKIVVHETGNVQMLVVENVSDQMIYIQSGDIVRGGKQDRVIANDMIISAKSGRVPVQSFCVEQGRWAGRGGAAISKFSSSSNAVCSNAVKLAVRRDKNQAAVWAGIARYQEAVGDDLDGEVVASISPTSLELTMDSEAVKTAAAEYTRKLVKIVDDRNDTVGCVAIINGRINCGDDYGSHHLFKKLWPKLLYAYAVEAVAEREKDKSFRPPDQEEVKAFLRNAQSGDSTKQEILGRVKCVSKETHSSLLFETIDRSTSGTRVHRNYLSKSYGKVRTTSPKGPSE